MKISRLGGAWSQATSLTGAAATALVYTGAAWAEPADPQADQPHKAMISVAATTTDTGFEYHVDVANTMEGSDFSIDLPGPAATGLLLLDSDVVVPKSYFNTSQ